MISDFGKEAAPVSVSRVKSGHSLFEAARLLQSLLLLLVTCALSRYCVCVHSQGLAGISPPAPGGHVQA